jgi:hypothetical protein
MAETLERKEAAPLGVETESLWIGQSDNWVYASEPPADLWDVLSTPVSKRRGAARDFASAIANFPGVAEVWITDLSNDLDMAVALSEPEAESDVRRVFIDLVCERLNPSEGTLYVFPGGEVPNWVEKGQQLV